MDYATLSMLLIGSGILVIVVEMFVPSAGLLGIVAGTLLLGGVLAAFMHSMFFGLIVLTGTALAMPVLFVVLVKVWPLTPLGKTVLMNDTIENFMPDEIVEVSIGEVGVAKTKMLPSGSVEIDGKVHDAVSDGFAINPEDPVKVVAIRSNRIYVQPFDGEVDEQGRAVAADNSPLATPLEELGIDEDLYE